MIKKKIQRSKIFIFRRDIKMSKYLYSYFFAHVSFFRLIKFDNSIPRARNIINYNNNIIDIMTGTLRSSRYF